MDDRAIETLARDLIPSDASSATTTDTAPLTPSQKAAALEKKRGEKDPEGQEMCNVYVPNLLTHSTDDDLRRLCECYGPIVSCKVIVGQNLQYCRGFGFCLYEDPESAQRAVKGLRAKGHVAALAKHGSYSSRLRNMSDEESTNIYIQNIPHHFTEQSLADLLSPFGSVMSSRILRTPDGTSRGVGFSRMETRQAAEEAIEKLNGVVVDGGSAIQMRFADTPGQKKLKDERRFKEGGFAPMQQWQYPVHPMALSDGPPIHLGPFWASTPLGQQWMGYYQMTSVPWSGGWGGV